MTDRADRNSENSEIDVERLLEEIRRKLAQKDKPVCEPVSASEPMRPPQREIIEDGGGKKDFLDISTIQSTISSAEVQSDIGAQVSPMLQFGALTRQIALFVGKIVVYLSKFMTDKQRGFNEAIIDVLRRMTDDLGSLKRENVWIEKELTAVKSTMMEFKGSQREIMNILEGFKNTQREIMSVIEGFKSAQREINSTLEDLRNQHNKTVSDLKTSITLQERRLDALQEEAL